VCLIVDTSVFSSGQRGRVMVAGLSYLLGLFRLEGPAQPLSGVEQLPEVRRDFT
jgi:hypothetical protein